ncbi:hypothetical protein ACWGS9_33580 [Bradyrhizobium sp. Arg314]
MNRRALLLYSSAAVFNSAATAGATEPSRQDRMPADELRALIEAHMTAYVAFGKAVREMGGSSCDLDRASRKEERALLAVCAYPAVSESDRLAKVRYLLKIEARGELDLPEHIQALLRSMLEA